MASRVCCIRTIQRTLWRPEGTRRSGTGLDRIVAAHTHPQIDCWSEHTTVKVSSHSLVGAPSVGCDDTIIDDRDSVAHDPLARSW